MALNHNIFNRRNYFRAVLVIAGIILLFIIFRGRAYVKDHSATVAELKRVTSELKAEHDRVDSLSTAVNAKTHILTLENSILLDKVDSVEDINRGYGRQVTQLTANLRAAKNMKDTVKYYVSCDSLAIVAEDQRDAIANYEMLIDSTTANFQQQIAAQTELLEERAALNNKYRTSTQWMEQQIKQQDKDYNKLVKKHKRERTLSRVLAVAVLALGTLQFVK